MIVINFSLYLFLCSCLIAPQMWTKFNKTFCTSIKVKQTLYYTYTKKYLTADFTVQYYKKYLEYFLFPVPVKDISWPLNHLSSYLSSFIQYLKMINLLWMIWHVHTVAYSGYTVKMWAYESIGDRHLLTKLPRQATIVLCNLNFDGIADTRN